MLSEDEELFKIKELQQLFEQDSNDFTPEEKLLVTLDKNKTFKRFLVAQKWSTVKALENIKSMILWRRDFKPLDLTDVDQEAEKGWALPTDSRNSSLTLNLNSCNLPQHIPFGVRCGRKADHLHQEIRRRRKARGAAETVCTHARVCNYQNEGRGLSVHHDL